MKLAAAVVTYNRKNELVKNIKTILSQSVAVDRYYIIDNHGSDGTKELLEMEGLLENPIISYFYMPENLGGAGGFYTGTKMAYEDGFDYVCLMDDDGRPYDDLMLEKLVSKANQIYSINKKIMLNPIVMGADGFTLSFGLGKGIRNIYSARTLEEDELIMNRISPFNGTFISKELIDCIGLPNKDFFIKGDETDYYKRAMSSGAFVATVMSSNYFHPILQRNTIKFMGREFELRTESPWKEYYRARNYTYMFKRDKEFFKLYKGILSQIISAFVVNPKKIQAMVMILRGWKDGITGHLGTVVRP